MKKWRVTYILAIQANSRKEVWKLAEELSESKLRGLASIAGVSLEPIDDDWIAINEPIQSHPSGRTFRVNPSRVKISRIAQTGEVVVEPL